MSYRGQDDFRAAHRELDADDRYHAARNNVRETLRRPWRGDRSSGSRGQFQEKRVTSYRIKTAEDAMNKLEALQVFKAIELCVTTRQMGFGTVQVFVALRQFNNVPVDVKVLNSQTERARFVELPPDENLITAVKPLVLISDQISSVINAIVHVKTNDSLYVPKIGNKSMLALHVSGVEGLQVYQTRVKLEGDVSDYYNLERLTSTEQVDGCLHLLGECPTTEALEFPVYICRNEAICEEVCSMQYRATIGASYRKTSDQDFGRNLPDKDKHRQLRLTKTRDKGQESPDSNWQHLRLRKNEETKKSTTEEQR
ncbi:hypothetical protein JTB14_017049 [Gonioctena quinquepunctata]|nr:hypothetical protein JTB14_017049 [Gonioctena quinquepunctata]